jgi:putative NIF3 family GTP cyclohydrolase 1 type 2
MTRNIADRARTCDRRTFAAGIVTAAAIGALPAMAATSRRITVGSTIEAIRAGCAAEGITWNTQTVDTLKAGNLDMVVSGIAATFISSLPVLRSAVAAGANLIVTHEPTFWNHADSIAEWRDDPVYQAKTAFIEEHGLAIFRFHDHWHQSHPEPMSAGTRTRLGWQDHLVAGGSGGGSEFEARYVRKAIALSALVAELRIRLPSRSIRFIGRPETPISRIAFGTHSLDSVVQGLAWADVLIVPEVREFDSGAYVRDLLDTGAPKALIMIAHERGEEDGMELCTRWLRRHVHGVRVSFIASGEPFWSPAPSNTSS